VADHPVPTGREEDWRFTPLPRLRGLLDDVGSGAHLTWTTSVPAPADLGEISSDEARSLGLPGPGDRVAALAARHSGGAVRLRVPAGTELDGPVLLHLQGTGGEDAVHGHLVIDVGANAKATVVLEHSGSARYAELVSVRVGDGASLELVGLSLWDDDAVHAGQTAVQVGRDATVRVFQVSLGGDLVRLLQTVSYAGPGGDAELLGLYFADAGQHLEHRLFVDHSTPHCRSNVLYKGALQGESAHTVWIGDVLIRPEAIGTDTFELNRNLVLTDGARADSVPNLEIETGEVESAGHASATGRFDDEQLFYLQARGIPAEEARRLVVRGFFAEMLGRIGVPEVRDRLMAEVERELAESLP
jgi:Fe-S cluster assembly protein SufD